MNHAAEIDTMSARRALLCAVASLDKGHDAAAEAWAETAATIIRESKITPSQQRQLVAPNERPKLGDYVVGALSSTAITWFVVHRLWSLL